MTVSIRRMLLEIEEITTGTNFEFLNSTNIFSFRSTTWLTVSRSGIFFQQGPLKNTLMGHLWLNTVLLVVILDKLLAL